MPGYASVTLSLKPTGMPPGDATDKQMDYVADLADEYTFGEIRVSHEQNLMLADVQASRDLYDVWERAKALGFATPNIGLLTDIICVPGRRFLLAREREVDPDRARHSDALQRPRLRARHRRPRR